MLPREHRLHPRSRVRSTIRRGTRVRTGQIVVHYLAEGDGPQAAVVVGRGVGGAVERHHRQRQVRHALAQMWSSLPTGAIVVRVLPGEADFQQLRGNLESAMARL